MAIGISIIFASLFIACLGIGVERILFDSTPAGTRVKYQPLPGNCKGTIIKAYTEGLTLTECMERCDLEQPSCVGFSYSVELIDGAWCLLKSDVQPSLATCERRPLYGSTFIFYLRKIIPVVGADSDLTSPMTMLLNQTVYKIKVPGNISTSSVDSWTTILESSSKAPIAIVRPTPVRKVKPPIGAATNLTLLKFKPTPSHNESDETRHVRMVKNWLSGPQRCTPGTDSNHGDEFVIMFMSNRPDDPQYLPLEIYVTPADPGPQPVTVEVSMPLRPYDCVTQTKQVYYDDVATFFLPLSARMNYTAISDRGVRVRSLTPGRQLIVYGINKDTFTNDGFLGLPVGSLGFQYFIVTWAPSEKPNEFGIVATEDSTTIAIELSRISTSPIYVHYNNRDYSNGETIILMLNKFESFLAINENREADLTGSCISSAKPISVFSGNSRTSIEFTEPFPSRDHLVEQIPPVELWGNRYVTVSTPGRTVGDYFKIIASHPKTSVRVSGINANFILDDPGCYSTVKIPSGMCVLIEASNPILVAMFVLSQRSIDDPERADPSMMILPPIDQFRNHYVFSTTDYAGRTQGGGYRNYIMVAADRSYLSNGFILDGNPVPLQSQSAVASSNFVCGYVKVPSGKHSLTPGVAGDGVNFMGILYGAGDRESYGFPIGMQLRKLSCVPCRQENPCDNYDNNCNGYVDEQLCTASSAEDPEVDCCGNPTMVPPPKSRYTTTRPTPHMPPLGPPIMWPNQGENGFSIGTPLAPIIWPHGGENGVSFGTRLPPIMQPHEGVNGFSIGTPLPPILRPHEGEHSFGFGVGTPLGPIIWPHEGENNLRTGTPLEPIMWPQQKSENIFGPVDAGSEACSLSCGDIPAVANALHNARNSKVGSSVTYMCLTGEIIGNPTIVCGGDLKWSAIPLCS